MNWSGEGSCMRRSDPDPKLLPPNKQLTMKQALLVIGLSVCLISGTCFLLLTYYQHVREKHRQDDSNLIVAIIQTSPEREGLKTGYLAELLDLSIDQPRNLYDFNTLEAAQKLMEQPIIKEAKVRKVLPSTIHIDYELRKPIAFVGDYANTAIDADGFLFPFKPFYTPKKLPEIYFGEDEEDALPLWGSSVSGKRKDLAFELLDLSSHYCDEFSSVSCIDVSNAFASSDGQRQIILMLEDRFLRVVDGQTILCIYPRILRLRQENFLEQLGNYCRLRTHLREQDRTAPLSGKGVMQQAEAVIVDLRLSELAFFY